MPIICANIDEALIKKLDVAAGKGNRSRFIAQCVETHLSLHPRAAADERELQDLQKKLTASEHELTKLRAEIEQLRDVNMSLRMQCNELARATQEGHTSHEAVITGLQHNLELKEALVKALEREIALHKDTIHGLKDDKERLRQQNEV